MWWEYTEKNIKSNEIKVTKDCGYVLLPRLLTDVIRCSNRPAQEINEVRNEMAKGLARVSQSLLLCKPE